MCDSANTFPVYKPDALVQFFRTEVLIGQEAKHFAKSDITPTPKVSKTLKFSNFIPIIVIPLASSYKRRLPALSD